MTWNEFLGWQEFYAIEPWGDERADLRSGIVASIIANVNRDPKRRTQPFEPTEFMPFYRKPQPTPEELARKIRMVLGRFGS